MHGIIIHVILHVPSLALLYMCVLNLHMPYLFSLAARSVAVAQQSGVAAYVPGVSSLFSPGGRPTYCQPRNRRAGQGP